MSSGKNRINVFRGSQHAHFAMFEMSLNAIGRGDIINTIHDAKVLDSLESWVFPIPTHGMWRLGPDQSDTGHTINRLEDGLWDILQKPNSILLLDAAGEGLPIMEATLNHLHNYLNDKPISANRIVYLTSAVDGKEEYESWCKNNGVSPMFTVIEHPMQLFYCSGVYRTAGGLANYEERFEYAYNSMIENKHRELHYLTLNYSPRNWRYAVVLYLLKNNLLGKGLVSFHGPGVDNGSMDTGWQNIDWTINQLKNLQIEQELIDLIPDLHAMCPIVFEDKTATDRFGLAYNIQDYDMYKKTYFSVVTESDYNAAAGIRITEKSLKPLANLHPFIVIGHAGSLKEIKRLGFKTFDSIIDESYDDIEDDKSRLDASLKEVHRLCSLSILELHELYRKVWPILVYNFNHFTFGARAMLEQDEALKYLGYR